MHVHLERFEQITEAFAGIGDSLLKGCDALDSACAERRGARAGAAQITVATTSSRSSQGIARGEAAGSRRVLAR
jgi:hypothetical protein